MTAAPATNNPSATGEALPVQNAVDHQQAPHDRRHVADACAAEWNAVHDAVGSFADEHSTL